MIKVGPFVGGGSGRAGGEAGGRAGGEAENESLPEYDNIKLSAEMLQDLLTFCVLPKTKNEMKQFCNMKADSYFREKVLLPMLEEGLIKRTIPDKPSSPKQRYVRA